MYKVLRILLLMVLCASLSMVAFASNEECVTLTGNVEEKVSYLHTSEEWQSLLSAELGFGYDYGEQARFFFHPALHYTTILGQEGRLTVQLREGYVDLYLKDLDLRVGRQLVNWGSGYKLNPTDQVNPMDLTAADPTAADQGVAAVKGEYYLGQNLLVTGVVVGEFVPAKLPEEMKNLPAQAIQANLSQQLLGYVHDPVIVGMLMKNLSFATTKPEIKGVGDLEYACKVTRRDLYGYDVSLSFFHGYEDYPSLHSEMPEVVQTLISGQKATVEFGYQRTNMVGLDLIGEVKGIGVWSETAFSINEGKQNRLESVLGIDYTFGNNLYAVGQWYHRNPLNIEEETMQNYLLVHAQMPVRKIHQVSTTLMYDMSEQAVMVNPEMKMSLYDNLTLKVGTLWIHGLTDHSQSLLSNFGNSQSYLGVAYGF